MKRDQMKNDTVRLQDFRENPDNPQTVTDDAFNDLVESAARIPKRWMRQTMPEKKNALEELAERLKNGYASLVVNDRQVATFTTAAFPELDKAQRIVAELAKVKTQGLQYNQMLSEFMCVYTQCRAIAEEAR